MSHDAISTHETEDRQYKDDRDDFAQSSDLARTGKSEPSSGQGPESSESTLDPERARGNNHGSQADWQRPSPDEEADGSP